MVVFLILNVYLHVFVSLIFAVQLIRENNFNSEQ